MKEVSLLAVDSGAIDVTGGIFGRTEFGRSCIRLSKSSNRSCAISVGFMTRLSVSSVIKTLLR